MNLGRYQLMRKLASGGMAEVYLAKAAGPMGFEKKLVVKRILPHLAQDESFIEMFFAEARLVARLDHPHIVQIFDFGEADGEYFIAMEYIDGLNLRILLKRVLAAGERLPIALCAKIVSSACEGLAYAHEFVDPDTQTPLHLVHRDISPDNLLVSSHGAVKLADFGIAKAANQMHRTQTGAVKGKVAYMPPEQLKGKSLDARADLFALGVVLYELLSGRRPFEAENEMALMQAILNEEPVPVTHYRAEVPAAMQRILARALARERSARYASCRELQADLERFLRTVDEPVGAVDIARWVARFSPDSPADALRTPNAKLLLETPAAPASVRTRTAQASKNPSRERDTEVVGKVTSPVGESSPDDSTRTDPSRTRLPLRGPLHGRGAAVMGLAALLLASAGYGFWRVLRPKPSVSVKAPAVTASEPVAHASPPVTQAVPPPSPPDRPAEKTPTDEPKAPSPTENQGEAKAFFRVESSVAGSVLVGGKSFGSTPANVTGISPGQVSVEVRNKQKGFSKKRTVELAAGDNGTLEFNINKGRLSFHVLPYATVWLDGRELGDTPLPPVEVFEGSHRIKLSNEKQGAPVEREFTVKPGDNEFTFNFNAAR